MYMATKGAIDHIETLGVLGILAGGLYLLWRYFLSPAGSDNTVDITPDLTGTDWHREVTTDGNTRVVSAEITHEPWYTWGFGDLWRYYTTDSVPIRENYCPTTGTWMVEGLTCPTSADPVVHPVMPDPVTGICESGWKWDNTAGHCIPDYLPGYDTFIDPVTIPTDQPTISPIQSGL